MEPTELPPSSSAPPFVVRFVIESEDINCGMKLHTATDLHGFARYIPVTVGVFAALIGGVFLASGAERTVLGILFLLFGFYFLTVRGAILARLRKNRFAETPGVGTTVEWTFHETGFEVSGQFGCSNMPWGAATKAVIGPEALLLYSAPRLFHYIPKRGVDSDAYWNQVCEWVSRNVSKTVHLTERTEKKGRESEKD
jgi:hypothetical protein